MAHNSEHINYSNQKMHSYDKMIKMIVNLGSNKCKNNNNPTCQLSHINNFLLLSIVGTPEKDSPNVDFGNQT